MTQKANLRKIFLSLRNEISQARREESSKALFDQLIKSTSGQILSHVPFRSEIDLTPFNRLLAKQGRLILPRCNEEGLELYAVTDLDRELSIGSYNLMEPNPLMCSKVDLTEVEFILVPGLAFDDQGYRLGYGKGLYDRLLAKKPIPTIGIGFKEQKSSVLLPRDSWDLPVQKVLLT